MLFATIWERLFVFDCSLEVANSVNKGWKEEPGGPLNEFVAAVSGPDPDDAVLLWGRPTPPYECGLTSADELSDLVRHSLWLIERDEGLGVGDLHQLGIRDFAGQTFGVLDREELVAWGPEETERDVGV